MTTEKCDYDYNNDSLHIHKNKCENCEYYSDCEYVAVVKAIEGVDDDDE